MECEYCTFKISEADVDEQIDELLQLEKQAFKPGVGMTEKEALREYLEKQEFIYTAGKRGEIVAYIAGKKIDSKRAEVTSITVAKEHRREGIANELMKRIHDRMRKEGLEAAGLTVGAEWDPAINLYEKRGYNRLTGEKLEKAKDRLEKVHNSIGTERNVKTNWMKRRLKDYYPTGEDAYRLRKNLDNVVRSN